jgi:hypothetical protein
MADLTARFKADFSTFSAAVDGATAELKGLESGAGAVEGSLNRMVDKFSGRKLIQDAELMTKAIEEIGGVSKLTETELQQMGATINEAAQKMEALGMTVPDSMRDVQAATKDAGTSAESAGTSYGALGRYIAGAFTVTAVIGFTKEVAAYAGEVKKASDQTGIATDTIQELMHIAEQTSVSFDALVNASQTLSTKMGSNDAGLQAAAKELGLSLYDLKQMSPADAMYTLAAAVGKVEDPYRQLTLAQDVFGKSAKEIIPAVKADMDALAAAAPKMGQAQVEWWDKVVASMKGAYAQSKVTAGGLIADMGMLAAAAAKFDLRTLFGGDSTTEIWDRMAKQEADFLAGILPVVEAVHNQGKAFEATTLSGDALSETEKKLTADAEASIEAHKKHAVEMERYEKNAKEVEDALHRVMGAQDTWKESLAQLDPALVQVLEAQLRAGVSAEDLAKAYGLTSQASKALTLDIREQDTAQRKVNEATAETSRLEGELDALRSQRRGASLDNQIAAIDKWAARSVQALHDNEKWTQQSEDTIAAIRQEKILKATMGMEQFSVSSRGSLQEVADKAQATFLFMSEHSDNYSKEAIADQQQIAAATQDAANLFVSSSMAAASQAAAAHQAAAQSVAMSWSQAMSAAQAGQGTMSTNIMDSRFTEPKTVEGSDRMQKAAEEGLYYGPVDKMGNPDYERMGRPMPSGGLAFKWGQQINRDGSRSYLPALRADGGPVSARTPYVVGEKGPELFVPGASGSIVPNGAGGSAMVNNFYINGTGADVARVVSSELTRLMRVGRKWPSV